MCKVFYGKMIGKCGILHIYYHFQVSKYGLWFPKRTYRLEQVNYDIS